MKKVLFVASVTGHIISFHIPYLKWFTEQGYEVHVASRGNEKIEYCDKHFDLPFERFPLKFANIKTYKNLKKIIDENQYEIIHSHTPVGGVLARLAARKARKKYGTKSIYTAHGFHFYKGAPFVNWVLYYPIEWYLAKYTNAIVTINREDYKFASKRFKKRCKHIEYTPGIGINADKYSKDICQSKKNEIRKTIGLQKEDFAIIYIARLDKNKNQTMIINVVNKLVRKNKNLHLLLVRKRRNEWVLSKHSA